MPKGQRFPLEVMLRAMREVDNGVPLEVVSSVITQNRPLMIV